MAETRLLQALEEEAKRQEEAILQSARSEAERIIDEARKRKERSLKEEEERIRERLLRERQALINRVRREEKEKLLNLKWQILEGVFEEARESLRKEWEDRKEEMTLSLVREVLHRVGKDEKGVIRVPPSTVGAVKGIVPRGIRVEALEGIDGVVLSLQDGRIEYRDTITSRLEKVRRVLLHEIGNILFG